MRTLSKALQELLDSGGWSLLDIHNLISDLTGRDESRRKEMMSLMLFDIEKMRLMQNMDQSTQDLYFEYVGINLRLDTRHDDRRRFYDTLSRVRTELRELLLLDIVNRNREHLIVWKKPKEAMFALIEALIKHGYVSNQKPVKLYGHFMGVAEDEVEPIDWVQTQRMLIRMFVYLMENDWVIHDAKPWILISNHFTIKGNTINRKAMGNDKYFIKQEHSSITKGWDKLEALLNETLLGFA